MTKPVNKGQGHSSSMQTPPFALWPLYQYLKPTTIIWESACGKGYLTSELLKRGYKVKWSDIERDKRENFFTFQPKVWDVQITNPPFDIKNKWLERSYALGKPFALLLPVETLSTPDRVRMFAQFGIEVIIPNHRYHFETPNFGESSWLDTAWFTFGLHIGRSLSYYEYSEVEWREASAAWKSHLTAERNASRK